MHEADKTPAQPQFYTGCAQVFLTSSGTSLPSNTVSIPGYVKAADASVNFNIYTPVWPYSLPGPAVFTSSSASTIMTVSSTTQTEGLEPANSVLKNANWYGIELDSYSTENGCWSVSSTISGLRSDSSKLINYRRAVHAGLSAQLVTILLLRLARRTARSGRISVPPLTMHAVRAISMVRPIKA